MIIHDIIKFDNKEYQVSTVYIENMYCYETMIFPIIDGKITGKSVYKFRSCVKKEAIKKHKDILEDPNLYISEYAISKFNHSEELDNYSDNEIAEWVMSLDDFDDGLGNRQLPHCSKCNRGVYKHDAGKWCTFCGRVMKNPMVQ